MRDQLRTRERWEEFIHY